MKKPFAHAFGAALYIIVIVLVIQVVTKSLPQQTIIIPMVMLSLFVLSAAVMGFLFLSEPVRLYMENKKDEATVFFGKTVGVFAVFAAIFVILLFVL